MSVPAITLWSLFLLIFPAVTQWGERRYQALRWIGAITLCYLCGLILGNTPGLQIPEKLFKGIMEASVSLAIPVMLFTTHPRQLLSSGKQALIAFGIACLSATTAAIISYLLMGHKLQNAAQISGMLAAVYTGGTPNMSAVGLALGAKHELFLILNSADILLSGLYFAILLTFGPALIGKVLPLEKEITSNSDQENPATPTTQKGSIAHISLTLLLAVLLLVLAAGICFLVFQELIVPVFILLLTALSLLAASTKPVHNLRGTFNTAHYLLLIFALSIGCLADFTKLLQMTAEIIPFCFILISTTIILHYGICKLAGLPRNISILASTAAIFGPAFIGPVAERIKAPHLILNGILMGMMGYAIGNFLGIGLARLLEQL